MHLIGVCGGSSSGKTLACRYIGQQIDEVTIISQDHFYHPLSPCADPHEHNFDDPSAIDFDSLVACLGALKRGEDVEIPQYDFKTHQRLPDTVRVVPTNVVIVEGILIFSQPRLLELLDLKIFVDADSDTRLSRRIDRDISERGRHVKDVIYQYFRFVKPAHERYIEPSKQHADIVLLNNEQDHRIRGIDLLCEVIGLRLAARRGPAGSSG